VSVFLRTSQYGSRIASVVHLAAYFDLSGEPNPKYEQVTVRGTERLINALKTFDLEQFVFISTMLVHSSAPRGTLINEDSPLQARFPYQTSKLQAERLVRAEHGGIPLVIVRSPCVYDDLGRSTFLVHQIARIYEKSLLSHLYPGDLDTGHPRSSSKTSSMRSCASSRDAPTYLRSRRFWWEPHTPSFGELQQDLGRWIHSEHWETHRVSKELAKVRTWLENEVLEEDSFVKPWMIDSADDNYELDISRARDLLGWELKHSLRATLPTIVKALKADPVSWYRANKLNAAAIAGREAMTERHGDGDARADAHLSGSQPELTRDGRHADHESHQAVRTPETKSPMHQMHLSMVWAHFTVIALGAWLAASPLVIGGFQSHSFSETILQVTADRNLAPPELRSAWLAWSDLLSGVAIMVFGSLSLSRRFARAQWANTVVGIWLLFSPLVFWAPSATVYFNDTFVGAFVIAFAVLVPMMPGMSLEAMMDQSDLPLGWSYCPSTYVQRLPIIALGLVGFLIARMLTAYQLGYIDHVWDPFFATSSAKNGTEFIITSNISKAWPIPDAGLGAVSYLFEVLMGAMGDRRRWRWRSMPWMVAMFGIVVVPLGAVSITFIIIQPIVIGTYCTLCLVAALAMLIMIPLSLDELVAMAQYLVEAHRRGEQGMRVFFAGGASPGSGRDEHADFGDSLANVKGAASRGVTVPWTLLATALLGVWLMFTRLILDTEPPMASSDYLVGALISTVAVTAMAEVGRALRLINVAFGLWLIAAPWILHGTSPLAAWASVAIGTAVAALSLPRGRRSSEHYGSWDCYIV
jgi:nucleoside-diphosphate-sugar epimerase